jgi:uncharacterized OsmC-like protein
MVSMKVQYNGDLRCTATHIKSGNQVVTDAPTDNNGKGEAFSPTDLLCTSLTTCMITLMGITANSKDIQLGQIDADIEKIMGSEPRRVSGINIQFQIKDLNFSEREKEILKNAALTCPVAKSIHSDIELGIDFQFV